jgi:naphthoate synthase
MVYQDIQFTIEDKIAVLTIDRQDRLNALRARTVDELSHALRRVWADTSLRCVILTGSGDKAFCAGGDIKQRLETGDYGPSADGRFDLTNLHRLIRDIPQPVIAAVNGVAIGGGHVLHVICDLSIAADHARFGQVGPRTGSFDAGFGSAYLARVVGEKRAREIWFLCRQYSAADAERWGLVNAVVPGAALMDTAREWAAEVCALSPTALRFLKTSFNADTEQHAAFASMGRATVDLYMQTEEAKEGLRAFVEKRPPDFPDLVSF